VGNRGRSAFIAVFLFPATFLYVLFVVWPVAQAFVFSLFRWRGVSQARTFVGLENFGKLVADSVFWQSLWHNMALLVGAGLVILALSLALAHAMQVRSRSAHALRAVYLFPQVTSLVAIAILWSFIFSPSFGIINNLLRSAGLERWALPWLGNQYTALACVGVAFVWHALGFYIMLFSAGLRTIPDEVRVALIYLVINCLNVFALVFLMTQGGPDRHSEVMLTYLYEQAFEHSEFGFATALAVANFLIVMVLSALVMAAFRKDPTEART
jgi:N-acetylglucosamine transport system permease protein